MISEAMNSIRWHFLVAALASGLFWLASSSRAELVTSLYQVAVPVEARSEQERQRAQRQGFAQVIVKVSGNSQVLAEPNVRASLANADRFLEQYGFETRTVPSPNGIMGPSEQTLLTMKFDATAVNEFLRRQGIQIWASNRPRTLLWLSYPDSGQTRLVTSADSNTQDVRLKLEELAERRGLPLVLPKVNAGSEQVRLANQVADFDLNGLWRQGSSYGPDIMAIARVSSRGLVYELNGLIKFSDDQKPIAVEHSGLDATLATFIERLADNVADRLAVVVTGEPGQNYQVEVSGVDRLQDYAGLMEYLTKLIAVKTVQVQWVKGQQVGLLVGLESNRDAFLRSLDLDKKLVAVAKPETIGAQPVEALDVQDIDAQGGETQAIGSPVIASPSIVDRAPALPTLYFRWVR